MEQIACHQCDLIHNIPHLAEGTTARCVRCNSVLTTAKTDSVNRTLAWTFASFILYCVAITYPFLAMKSGALVQETALLSGVQQLFMQGEIILATVVFLTCLVIPLLQMLILLYIFIPLAMNKQLVYAIPLFRVFLHVKPWSMMEIYLIGILVAMVKLGKMATIVPGVAAWAFAVLVITLTAAISAIDYHLVWGRLGRES